MERDIQHTGSSVGVDSHHDPSHNVSHMPTTVPRSSRSCINQHTPFSRDKNQPHKESLVNMTNREQPARTSIGSFVIGFLKNSNFLTAVFGITLAIASIIVKYTYKSGIDRTNIIISISTFTSLLIAGYFIYRTCAGTVRGPSTHYVLIICGSGGHTAEMVQMVERSILSEGSSHRRWAVGKDDEKSYDKIIAFEQRLFDRFALHDLDSGTFDIVRFGRARYVHQSWLTTPFTVILSLLDIIGILATPPHQRPIPALRYPGVIVSNGPGTGFLFILVARALRFVRIAPSNRMKTLYVESWARVKSLSLTGKLVRSLKLADTFIVQSRFLADSNNVLAENLLVMPQQPHVPIDRSSTRNY